MSQPISYRTNAAKCRADANESNLTNVRERHLRAEAAWLAMAERQERVDQARAVREAAVKPQQEVT